jgi:xanthomonalisin
MEGGFMGSCIRRPLALASVLAATAAITVGGQAVAAGWTNTATAAISPVQATDLGALATNTPMRISVALKLPNTAAVQALLKAQNTPGSPQYRTVLTPAQFNARYAPSAASVASVRQYLATRGTISSSARRGRRRWFSPPSTRR